MCSKLKVMVTGGRDFQDKPILEWVLSLMDNRNNSFGIRMLIQGGARGADTIAADWAAKQPGIVSVEYKADWAKYGKKAGILRNMEMIDKMRPDLVIACPGGKGTEHAVQYAVKKGVPVLRLVTG